MREWLRKEVSEEIEKTRGLVAKKIEEFKFHEALADIWALIGFGDRLVNEEKPWAIKDEKEKKKILVNLIVLLDNISAMIAPFLPEASEKITKSIVWKNEKTLAIKKGEVLFPRLQ
ncbi:MAG: class I tRNA ligase family protein [Candidatus Jorgensenbacteria bacterium]|nr:class I tRNA ligase family protein [Candidatus Jorgensenbacteria bacterium]